jgi:hypothetical protein
MKRVLIIVLALFLLAFNVQAEENRENIYSTWDVLELDACASAWLIKRFVNKDAVFKFYPKGELIEEGTAFDTPDAELRRRHGVSTFGSIINKYKIKDPKVLAIGKLIHQIEINYWNVEPSTDAKNLDDKIKDIISKNKDPKQILKKAFAFMDKVYEDMQ